MLAGLITRFRRLLKEIVTISSGIRNTILDYADDQNFDASDRLRDQLETIRVSADAILGAFAKASRVTSFTLDDQIADWLASEEPHSCLGKLREMNDTFRPIDDTEDFDSLPTPAEDKLTAAAAFFDNHKAIFHFLLTPDVWNGERPGHSPSGISQVDAPPATNDNNIARSNSITAEYENGSRVTMARRKKEFLCQKVDEISRWLAPLECAQKHKDGLRLRQEGTCKWFPNTDVYGKWCTPGNRFLWVHGKGGCGKSVLMAYTIERLQGLLKEEEVIAFFYCDFQNKRSTGSTELMRSLLSQLLHYIRYHGVDTGDFLDNILKQKTEGTLTLDDLEKLGGLVSRAASFFRYEPFVVIDALDECADIDKLLPVLVTWSQADIRLLVTSRPDQTIMDSFRGLQSLSFESVTEEIGADIALHVRRELDSHKRLRSAVLEMKDEIDAKLTRRAEGRFRWVQCQLDILRQCATSEELKEALDNLPGELEATYERILGAIDERKLEGELARRVLALLTVTIEPLQLAQVVDGLSMDFQKREHDREAQQWLETRLLQSLSSLVSYSEETDVLAISHYSVNEYLANRSALPMYQIITHAAHAEAAQMCMNYLSTFLKTQTPRNNLELWKSFPMLSYVLSSGFHHLGHVDLESTGTLETLESLGSDVRHHPSHWNRLCELREEVLEWPFILWPSSKHDFIIYTLIAYSPPGLLRTFLSGNRPLRPRIGTNPLVYAADLRKTEHALILLTYGADVNAQGLVIDDSRHASPLEVAIDLGDDVLVGELLERGCLVTSELLATAVCMPWCSTQVLAKLMQTDEFVEWALEIGDEQLYRGVFNSARPNARDSTRTDEDHVALARRLCQLGLDISAEDHFGKELVERSLHAGHISMLEFLLPPDRPPPPEFLIAASTGETSETVPVVRFLLQKGVDVNFISDKTEETALHLAAMCPWEPRSFELTKLLIDAGCNPHTHNSDDETSLVGAVRQGHCSVVKLLLSYNVPLPLDILHTALEQCQSHQMIECLLLAGANIKTVTQSDGTLLHHAIAGPQLGWDEDKEDEDEDEDEECVGLVKCFVEAGCDPTVHNSDGKTALEIAIRRGFISVIEFLHSLQLPLPSDILVDALQGHWTFEVIERLINMGVDLHSTSSSGDTVFHLAFDWGDNEETCCKMMERLIDVAGCDPTVCNSNGETALELALECGYTSVVELLLLSTHPPPPDALKIAMEHGFALEVVEHLIDNGADACSTTSDGDTVLDLAFISLDSDEGTYYKLAKMLINAGCNPTACNSKGEMVALMTAMEWGFTSVVKLLLPTDSPPNTGLLITMKQRSAPDVAQHLINRGADVHATMPNGDTLLHLALDHCYSEEMCSRSMKILLDAGCDPTACDSAGTTALEIAIQANFTSVVELLLSFNAPLPPNALLTAIWHGSTLKMIECLICRGADVYSTTFFGDTALHLVLAVHYSDMYMCLELMRKLIRSGCDPTACNLAGKTVLEIAIGHKFTSVVELLLSPDVPLPPDALLIALRQGSTPEFVERLIHRGADVHSTTTDGSTVIHLALNDHYTEKMCSKLMKMLIDAGGLNPIARDAEGRTIMLAAIERGYSSVVELLLSCNIPILPDDLPTALRLRCVPQIIRLLVCGGAYDRFQNVSESDWDALLQLAYTSYSGEHRRVVTEALNVARRARRIHLNSENETYIHIAKRPRLDA